MLLCSLKGFCDIIPSWTQMLRISCPHFSPGPLQKPPNLSLSSHTNPHHVCSPYTIHTVFQNSLFETFSITFHCTWDRQMGVLTASWALAQHLSQSPHPHYYRSSPSIPASKATTLQKITLSNTTPILLVRCNHSFLPFVFSSASDTIEGLLL